MRHTFVLSLWRALVLIGSAPPSQARSCYRVCSPFPGPFLLSGLRPLPKPVLQGSLGPSATYVFAIFISVRVGPAVGRQDEKDVPWTRGGVLEHVRGGPDGARLPPLLI